MLEIASFNSEGARRESKNIGKFLVGLVPNVATGNVDGIYIDYR